MIFATLIFGLLVLIILIGKKSLSTGFHKQVKELFSLSKNISERIFTYRQIERLPDPVQRYFKYVLKEGQPFISYARITHDGQFKAGADKNWVNITGEQYATTEKPGFIWKGKTGMFTARDMYIADKGRLIVSIFHLSTIVNGRGETYNQGELLRWLGESVLYPTNLLPCERLQWSSIDSHSARFTFKYNELSLFYIAIFNDIGEITQLETRRYMDKKNLETWIIKLADYKELNSIVVPTSFEVLWRLEKEDLSYAKFNVKKIEYNKPERFERGK